MEIHIKLREDGRVEVAAPLDSKVATLGLFEVGRLAILKAFDSRDAGDAKKIYIPPPEAARSPLIDPRFGG